MIQTQQHVLSRSARRSHRNGTTWTSPATECNHKCLISRVIRGSDGGVIKWSRCTPQRNSQIRREVHLITPILPQASAVRKFRREVGHAVSLPRVNAWQSPISTRTKGWHQQVSPQRSCVGVNKQIQIGSRTTAQWYKTDQLPSTQKSLTIPNSTRPLSRSGTSIR